MEHVFNHCPVYSYSFPRSWIKNEVTSREEFNLLLEDEDNIFSLNGVRLSTSDIKRILPVFDQLFHAWNYK